MKKTNRKLILIISATIVAVVVVVALVIINVFNTKNSLSQCENTIKEHIDAINNRVVDMHSYEDDSSLKTESEYKMYYEEITKSDKVYHKNVYNGKYQEDINFLEECLGTDFEIKYSINNKKALGTKYIRYIQDELRYVGDLKLEEIGSYEEQISKNLANFDITEDEINEILDLYKKYAKEQSQVKVTNAFKLDVKFTITGKENLEFEKEIYFAEVNGELLMLDYEPEEMEEDNEHFGFSNGINPTVIANEVELFMDFDWIERGVTSIDYGSFILEDFGSWIQNDDSGNRLYFTRNEENNSQIIAYVDASGNAIKGYEGINYWNYYWNYEDMGQFIYVYSDYDEETYEYSELKNVITFFYCNEDRAVLGINGKEIEFISE